MTSDASDASSDGTTSAVGTSRRFGPTTQRSVTPEVPGPLERPAGEVSAGRVITIAALALLPALALWLLWNGQTAFFLLFSGILLAALIDACVRGLERTGLERSWRFGIVVGVILLVLGGLFWFGGSYLLSHIGELFDLVEEQADELAALIETLRGRDVEERETALGVLRQVFSLLPGGGSGGSGVGMAASTAQTIAAYLANAVIIFFIGVFLAAEPGLYKRGMVRLFPPAARDEIDGALEETGQTLRNWLVGKLASMTMIFVFTWVGLMLVGYPFSFALGLLAGALAFIPNIGPILTYIPIALVGLSAGSTTTLIYGLVVYAIAQGVESYLFTPLIQKRMVELPPALIFFAQIIGGILFGLWGVALATPIAAVLKTLIEKLYLQDGLGENVDEVDPELRREPDMPPGSSRDPSHGSSHAPASG